MYELAFGGSVRIGIRSAPPSEYELESWWQTSAGSKTVVTESVAWLWSVVFFHPPAAGSPDEIWGDPEAIRRWRARVARFRAEGSSEITQ